MAGAAAPPGPPTVFLDACVLYPPLVRALLIGAAGAGLFRPRWSARVLEEWRLAVARRHGLAAEAEVEAARAALARAFPDAEVEADPAVADTLRLPDPADAHVLAAAAAAGARALVTFNLADFPRRAAAPLSVEVRHPDGFLWEALSRAPDAIAPAIAAALAAHGVAPDRARTVLKRAHLPRLGKAWAALSPDDTP